MQMFLELRALRKVRSMLMTDDGWAGDVKDRSSHSGIAVWVKGSVGNTGFPVYASTKKQHGLLELW